MTQLARFRSYESHENQERGGLNPRSALRQELPYSGGAVSAPTPSRGSKNSRIPRFRFFRVFRSSFVFVFLCFISRADAVEFSTESAAGKTYTLCRVDLTKEKLELFLTNDHGEPLKSFDGVDQWLQSQGKKLTFAMNAGMYEPGFSPCGLFVFGGRELYPLNLRNADGNFYLEPNGVFLIDNAGAHVIESSEYPKYRDRTQLATQSGPLLVRGGKLHPAFKPDSTSRLFRNGVGVPNPRAALFIIAETPVNLYEFATFFRDSLHCPDALFFDGTVSSLCAPALHRRDRKIDLGPIIGIAE